VNLQQQRFVDEYLIDAHATNAAIRAGYSKRTARIQASALLAKPHIKAAIAAKQAVRSEEAGDRAVRAAKRLEDIALMDLGDGTMRGVPTNLLSVVRAATVDLLKLDGMFTEKVEHSGAVDVTTINEADTVRRIAFLFAKQAKAQSE